jgi:hypothetical protein
MKILNFKDFNISESGEDPDENLFGMSENEFIERLRENLEKDGEGSIFKTDHNPNSIEIKWIFRNQVRTLFGILEDEMGCFMVEPNLECLGSLYISARRVEMDKNSHIISNKRYGVEVKDFEGIIFIEYNYENFDDLVKILREAINHIKDQVKNFEFKVEKHISVNPTIKKNIEKEFQSEANELIANLVDKPNLKYQDFETYRDDYSGEISDLLEECIVKSIYEDPKLKTEFESMPESTRKLIFKNLDGIVPEPDEELITRLEKIRGVKKFLRSIYA